MALIQLGDVVVFDERLGQYKVIATTSSNLKDLEEERRKKEFEEWKEAPY